MYKLPKMIVKGRRRHRPLWQEACRWLGHVFFAPVIILYAVINRGFEPGRRWVRGFLILGAVFLCCLGAVILSSQSSNQRVFASLGSFFTRTKPLTKKMPFAAEINAAASKYDCNPMAVYYVIQIESGGRTDQISSRGARGLMQIMPATWRELNPDSACTGRHAAGICKAGTECIFAPWGNIRVGTRYFAGLLRQYQGDYVSALQAYNAGQRNVVFSAQAKYAETRNYVASFMRLYGSLQTKQLEARLAAAAAMKRLITPLLLGFMAYSLLGTIFFWQNHLRGY